MREISIPKTALVVLVGASGSGKSTFARRVFEPFETLSSDFFRGLVSNSMEDQSATKAAFESLSFVTGKRLDAGLLTVVDATSVQAEARASLVRLAKEHDVLPIAIVLDVPLEVCLARNESRTDHTLPAQSVKRQLEQLRRSKKNLRREGFAGVHILGGEEEIDQVVIKRTNLLVDKRDDSGPFDIIGDVHGCLPELLELLERLGYELATDKQGRAIDATHPEGRRLLFVGDLVDRGPDSPGVLRLVMGMVAAGNALCVAGNHEEKLHKYLSGRKVQTAHGLALTLEQLEGEPAEFVEEVKAFTGSLLSHYVLDAGKLVVAHAGLIEVYQGRASARVRAFALYGDVSGEVDKYGLPVRNPWFEKYRGSAKVVYGHTPSEQAQWINKTMCLDTGAVFGGRLTALRYPEDQIIDVPATRQWCEPGRPFQGLDSKDSNLEDFKTGVTGAERSGQQLLIEDVLGKRTIQTGTHGRIKVAETAAAGALEVMSRWAIDPEYLPYLPPTMSPCESATEPGYLEFPTEAFTSYRRAGIEQVICEEKHMGSRATVLLARNPEELLLPANFKGVAYSRTGRPFFGPDRMEDFIAKCHEAMDAAGIWAELETSWILLDAEILPWSVKANDMIRGHYAAVGAAGKMALNVSLKELGLAQARGIDVAELSSKLSSASANMSKYISAYESFGVDEGGSHPLQIAPFQVLASQGQEHSGKSHSWHLDIADRLNQAKPDFFRKTNSVIVELNSDESVQSAIKWWLELTANGGEGMVVKPLQNLSRGKNGLLQPGLKVRGREYLRIIYGPHYTEAEELAKLRKRNTSHKRSMALREYALGIEAVTRLVIKEPLWRVHEAVFAILAMESEPVDPRL